MKSGILLSVAIVCCTIFTSTTRAQSSNSPPADVTDQHLKRAGVKPIGDWQVDPAETAYINSIFSQASAAAASIAPGPDASTQRRAIDNLLRAELEAFVATNTTSAYAPSIHLMLGNKARMRSAYYSAMQHYQAAFDSLKGSPDRTAFAIAHDASGALAKLLVLTGRTADFDVLQAQAAQTGAGGASGYDWGWATEMRRWVARHPDEAYKCGLYCLDQLGRTTQPDEFIPKSVLEQDGSPNGFTAAELVSWGTAAGLRVHAAALASTNKFPVPSIVHLRSDHFVFLREQRGDFYNILDPVAYGPKWMTLGDLQEEATGCVIVSDVIPLAAGVSLVSLDANSASAFRGRCHNPLPPDHDDCGGGDGGGNSGGCSTCGGPAAGGGASGMAYSSITEPFLNLWIRDFPISYQSAVGAPVNLGLSYTFRRQGSVVSGVYWRGTQIGNFSGSEGVWGCSWLSFAELSAGDATVDLMFPNSGWATFNFSGSSTISSNSFLRNCYLEKQGPAGGITNLVLHYPDGSTTSFGLYDKTTDTSFNGIFYMTKATAPDGNSTVFAYDSNDYLTNVVAADGTSFACKHDDVFDPSFITSVTSSYGASASFAYDQNNLLLTNIVDAAGLSSQIIYTFDPGLGYTFPIALATPYGLSGFNMGNFGIFDRSMEITNTTGTIEYYGQLNSYINGDWPDFSSSQIPTNTPLGTLDINSGERTNRNTFYWNAQQFAPFVNTDPNTFTWPNQLKYARIRHWLASTDGTYTHWLALSAQQEPAPDTSTQGQVTFFDYAGKPSGVNYEVGAQILPSVVARAMPDGSTWYQYTKRLTNGYPTSITEAWMDSGTVHTRSNVYVWAANNADLVAWTNALNVRVLSNAFNAFHQVVTNYDALGQVTTNGYDGTTHLITSSQNPAGLVTLYTYNGSHRLQSAVDLPVNRTNSYTWNSDGTMATRTDPRNMTETYFWDALHRPTGTSDARGSTTNLYTVLSGVPFPNGSGGTQILDRTATKDRLGNWTSYVYDGLRRKIAETNANGVLTGYSYCDCGSVTSTTNAWNTPVQEVTINNFDNAGRLTTTSYADNYNVTNWYDSLGRVIVRGDGAANRWLFYDNLGRLTVRSNAYGAELIQTYDIVDRPVNVTDANGVMVTNTYDSLNRLLTRGYPDGGVERFGYSAKGLTAYTNQLTMTNFYTLDELGRKTYETNANGEVLKFTNNAAGDLLSLTDGKNQVTQWNYDQYGRVTNKLDQLGTVVLRYFYDAQDRLTNRWSAAMGTTYYTNDPMGNVTYINYPSSTDVKFQYDSLNRLTNMVDAAGNTKYTYTPGNQVWTEVQPFTSSTITNTYSNRLRVSMTLQQPQSLWTNKFVYDAAGRLTNITSPAGAFSYIAGAASPGSLLNKKIALPNSSYVTNTFDNAARLTGTYLENSANSVLDSAVYGYNKASQRTAFTNAAGVYYQYYYDSVGQIKVADSSVNTEDRGYSYDSAWNVNWVTNNGTAHAFTVDGKNELTNWWPTGSGGVYDLNGNRTAQNSGSTTMTYDDENRLTSIVKNATYDSGFVYDGLGRLRERLDYTWNGFGWNLSLTTLYIYDGNRVVQERNGNNGASDPLVSYTRGLDLSGRVEGAGGIGGLLARSSGYSSGNWTTNHFYHADGNGNITYLEDSSQAMAATYRYDPFGNIMSSSGPMATANVYNFSSRQQCPGSGFYVYLYRVYDPTSDTWLNRDPLSEKGSIIVRRLDKRKRAWLRSTAARNAEANPYAVNHNDDLNQIDAFGLSPSGGIFFEETECTASEIEQCEGECWPASANTVCGDLLAEVPGDPDNPDFISHVTICKCSPNKRPPPVIPYIPSPYQLPEPSTRWPRLPFTPIFQCH